MISELRKSINSILYERVASPLFGTFILSWLVCNWKIVYLTLFISDDKIEGTKIDYIVNNYLGYHSLWLYPIISTLVLLLIIPFLSNGAYWVSLKFRQWRIDQRNEIEKTQLLTIKQSSALRREIRDQEIEFEKILEKKNQEENALMMEIESLKDELESVKAEKVKYRRDNVGTSYGSNDYRELKANKKVFEPFEKIARSIEKTQKFPKDIPEDVKEYYIINEIVQEIEDVDENGDDWFTYNLTNKGINLYKEFFNENFNKEK